MATYIIMAVIAYFIGSINFSVIIGRKMAGIDVRQEGSGNAGSTNVLRTIGLKAALLTLICDILKGIIAILVALLIGNIVKNIDRALLVQLAGIFVILGHTFTIFFEFKGGKGVATSLGIILLLNWQIGLICLVFALILMILTRMVSLGSISAAILFPVLTLFMNDNFIVAASGMKYFIYSLILALIVIFNHRENMKRIMNGTENKIEFKK